MIGMALAKSLYAIPTWTRTVALVREHRLAAVIAPDGDVPRIRRAIASRRSSAITRPAGRLHRGHRGAQEAKPRPGLGRRDRRLRHARVRERSTVRIQGRARTLRESSRTLTPPGGTAPPSDAQGRRLLRLPAAHGVCSKTDLPLAWTVETAKANETLSVAPLLEAARPRDRPRDCALDKGYDTAGLRRLRRARDRSDNPAPADPAVKRGEDKPPCCEHGEWPSRSRQQAGATKWRCPTGECTPASCGSRPTACTR